MSVSDLYKQVVIDHNREPRNYGELADATHTARGLNALCGDDIRVYARIDDNGVIEAVHFDGDASAITMAASSIMTQMTRGLTVEQALDLYARYQQLFEPEPPSDVLLEQLGDLAALSGVRAYPSRVKSATLGWETLRAALLGEDLASTE